MAKRLDLLGSNQKKELAETGSFTTSRGSSYTPTAGDVANTGGAQPVTDVPVQALENPGKPLSLPETNIDTSTTLATADEAVKNGDLLVAEDKKRAEAEQQARDAQSDSTTELKNLMGMEENKSVDRGIIEDRYGITEKGKFINETNLQIRQGTAALRAFDLQTIDDREMARQEAGARGGTKFSFGAQEREFNLQRSIERSHKASALESLAAVGSYAAGDLLLAQQQADRALATIYDPITKSIENAKFFHTQIRADLTEAQKAKSDTQMALINRQEASIQTAIVLANKAVVSGVATNEEVRQLTDPNLSPDERSAVANSVLARGSSEDRALSQQLTNAQIRSANRANREKMEEFDPTRQEKLIKLALMGDERSIQELGYDPSELGSAEKQAQFDKELADKQESIDNVNGLLENDMGLQASSGDIQSPWISGFFAGKKPQEGENFTNFAGTVPIVGNVMGSVASDRAKKTFLSESKFIIAGQGFAKLIEYKSGGATFGSLSDPERIAIQNSASKLASAAIWNDEATEITGFDVPEDVLRGYIADVERGLSDQKDVLISDFLPKSDRNEAANIWGEEQ